MKSELARNTRVDLAKAIAIFGVLIIHTIGAGYHSNMLSVDWSIMMLIRSIVSSCVPLFFMCSGALLLNPQKNGSIKQLYTKRLPRIIVSLMVWAMVYKLYNLADTNSLTLSAVFHAIKECLLFQHQNHLYFLQMIIIVYIWLPVSRVFTKNATAKELRYFIGVWFLVGILYPNVKGCWPFTLLGDIPKQWALNMTYAAIGYTVLGYYLNQYPISKKWSIVALVGGTAIAFGGTVLMTARTGTLYTEFLIGMSVGVALISAGIFGLCGSEHRFARSRLVRKLSEASFCIYLVHVLFISLLRRFGITTFYPYTVSMLLMTAVNMLLSYGIYAVLHRIPVIRDWLI